MNFLRNLTQSAAEKRQEMLTAYLDNALTPQERQQFETWLAQDAALRAEVERQRVVKVTLSQLPRRAAPRNFVLDPTLYGRPRPQPAVQLYPALRLATALTAFFLVVTLALGYVNGLGARQATLASAPAPVEVTRVVEVVAVTGLAAAQEPIENGQPELAVEQAAPPPAPTVAVETAPESQSAAAEESAVAPEVAASPATEPAATAASSELLVSPGAGQRVITVTTEPAETVDEGVSTAPSPEAKATSLPPTAVPPPAEMTATTPPQPSPAPPTPSATTDTQALEGQAAIAETPAAPRISPALAYRAPTTEFQDRTATVTAPLEPPAAPAAFDYLPLQIILGVLFILLLITTLVIRRRMR